MNKSLLEKYNELDPQILDSLNEFIRQATDETAAMRVNSQVLPQGRYTERAPRGAKVAKAPVVIPTGPVFAEEDTVFTRPNGDKYHARAWGEHQDVATLRKAREATALVQSGTPGSPMFALLYGAPGTGKTAMLEAAFGDDLYTVIGTGDTEVADFVGGYVQTASGGFEWIDGPLVRAVEEGKVLLIDEIGLVDPKVLSLVYGLMDGRGEITITQNPERGTVKAKDGFFVVSATNPNAPGVVLSEALLSRFSVQAEMTTDWTIARKLGVPAVVITASQNLAKKQASDEVSWSPQMREVLAFRDLAELFGTSFAISNLLASAPELDRPVVADVFSRAFGEEVKPARI
jgi:hypothetical protein